MTNYINADGTSSDCCIYREIELPPPVPSRRHTTGRAVSKRAAGEKEAEAEKRKEEEEEEKKEHVRARRPGITGHQSRESPASRRESATAPEAANPPPSSWFLFLLSPPAVYLSFHPLSGASLPPSAFSLLLSSSSSPVRRSRAFQRETTAPCGRFSSRSRGNLQITIMEELLSLSLFLRRRAFRPQCDLERKRERESPRAALAPRRD